MGQREVNATAELSATEETERLLPLLREYAAKLAALSERVAEVMEMFVTPDSNFRGKVQYVIQGKNAATPAALEAGRLICLHDTLEDPVTQLAQQASGLIEHAALKPHLRSELKFRLDELEEHGRYSVVMTSELVGYLTAQKEQAELVRKLIEHTGRYKAPF
jgi:hypothetical protein